MEQSLLLKLEGTSKNRTVLQVIKVLVVTSQFERDVKIIIMQDLLRVI